MIVCAAGEVRATLAVHAEPGQGIGLLQILRERLRGRLNILAALADNLGMAKSDRTAPSDGALTPKMVRLAQRLLENAAPRPPDARRVDAPSKSWLLPNKSLRTLLIERSLRHLSNTTATSTTAAAAKSLAPVLPPVFAPTVAQSTATETSEGAQGVFDLARPIPGTVSLSEVLSQLPDTSEGRDAVRQVLEELTERTGLEVPEPILEAALDNPVLLQRALEVTPKAMSEALRTVNGKLSPNPDSAQATKRVLPKHFDFSTFASLKIERPPTKLTPIVGSLLIGDLPSRISTWELKHNIVFAEVFDRLAKNDPARPAENFSVTFAGKTHTDVTSFAQGLAVEGYDVVIEFDARISNFLRLKVPDPRKPGAYLDVPATVMVKTGVRDANGHEAVVPAGHSEMRVSIRPGDRTIGVGFSADLRFFQGMSGIGFFPQNVVADPPWLGRLHHTGMPLVGEQAMKSLSLAGTLTKLIERAASRDGLRNNGYGITGVCNDSVAVVQQAVLGQVDQYPLLMEDGALDEELARHAGQRDYELLAAAIRSSPTDIWPDASVKRRALASIPWKRGEDVFASTARARAILERA
jgi:hypothetical protein